MSNINFYQSAVNHDITSISAGSELEFRYGNLDYQTFSTYYDDKGWKVRKITAIPMAFWSATVKVIVDVARTNFSAYSLYYIARDFQEAFGRVALLVDDRYGLFHIVDSQYQKLCYDNWQTKKHSQKLSTDDNEMTSSLPIDDEAASPPEIDSQKLSIDNSQDSLTQKKSRDALVACSGYFLLRLLTKFFYTSLSAAKLRAAEEFLNSGAPNSLENLFLRDILVKDRMTELLLKYFSHLRTLNFSNSFFLTHKIGRILELPNLIELNFGQGQIYIIGYEPNDNRIKGIANALEKNNTLTSIDLSGKRRKYDSGFTATGAYYIAEAIKNNKNLTSLNLRVNFIGDEGARYIAKALEKNETLTLLDLGDNMISDEGAHHIAESLKVNIILTRLILGHNRISDEGARHIAEALKVNSTIKWLDLSGCRIGEQGVRDITDALAFNKTPRSIDLGYQYLNGVRAWNDLIKSNV